MEEQQGDQDGRHDYNCGSFQGLEDLEDLGDSVKFGGCCGRVSV